jgi:hypothetical protein
MNGVSSVLLSFLQVGPLTGRLDKNLGRGILRSLIVETYGASLHTRDLRAQSVD